MIADSELSEVKATLASAQSVYVVMGSNPTTDVVAAGLAWYLSLIEFSKNAYIVCESEMLVEWSHLVGLDKVGQKLGNKNLVVSFDYSEDKVDRVSFDGANSRFNLVIQPKTGNPPPDPSTVSFGYAGADAEVVILPGVSSYASLGSLYTSEPKLFANALTVRLDNKDVAPFAKKNLVDTTASGVSEVSFSVLKSLGMSVQEDIASNLMAGIDAATERFSRVQLSANTFMAAAKLLDNGAKRLPVVSQAKPGMLPSMQRPSVLQPMSQAMSAQRTPQVLTEDRNDDQEPMYSDDEKPPDEWLQPKIYRGSTKI